MKKILSILLSCALVGVATSCSDDNEQPNMSFDSSVVSPVEDFTDPRDQQVYPCVKIGDQIWMTRNLAYKVPGYSMSGCFTWGENRPDIERVKVWPDYTPSDELFLNVVNIVINDPQYDGWNGQGAILGMYIPFYLNGMPAFGMPGMPQTDIVNMLKNSQLTGDSSVDPAFIEAVEERIKTTAEFQAFYGETNFQQTEEDNDHYSEKYGMLYSYEAAMKAVPDGWRLPTDEDWLKLEKTLGLDDAEARQFNAWRGKGLATLMNENGESGLNLQKGGANVYVEFKEEKYLNKGENGYYWSSTRYQENDSTEVAVFRMSAFYSDKIWRGSSRIKAGSMRDVLYSVRCVKDAR